MKKFMNSAMLAIVGLMMSAPMAFASEGGGEGGGIAPLIGLGCVVGLGIAAGGCGIGMGHTVNGAVNAMARNPGFYQRIFTNMMIGLALIEGFVIYTLVVAFMFMFMGL